MTSPASGAETWNGRGRCATSDSLPRGPARRWQPDPALAGDERQLRDLELQRRRAAQRGGVHQRGAQARRARRARGSRPAATRAPAAGRRPAARPSGATPCPSSAAFAGRTSGSALNAAPKTARSRACSWSPGGASRPRRARRGRPSASRRRRPGLAERASGPSRRARDRDRLRNPKNARSTSRAAQRRRRRRREPVARASQRRDGRVRARGELGQVRRVRDVAPKRARGPRAVERAGGEDRLAGTRARARGTRRG